MIKFNDGRIDNRVVVDIINMTHGAFAVVINDDGTYEKVIIDDSHSDGYLEPIFGGPIAKCFPEATKEQTLQYLKDWKEHEAAPYHDLYEDKIYNRLVYSAGKGYVIEVVAGRKYPIGTRGYFIDLKEVVVPGTYGKVSYNYAYLQTKGGIIKVPAGNCVIVNIDGNSLDCKPLSLDIHKKFKNL